MNMITTKDKTEMYYKFGDRDNLLSSATAGRPTPMPGKTRRFTWRPTVIVASPMIVPIGDSAHAGRVQTRYECDLEGSIQAPLTACPGRTRIRSTPTCSPFSRCEDDTSVLYSIISILQN